MAVYFTWGVKKGNDNIYCIRIRITGYQISFSDIGVMQKWHYVSRLF